MNRGVLTAMRDVVPLRPLSQSEAYRIAELQASRLLKLAGIKEPSVPDGVILDVPKIQVRYMKPWPVSGCTDWTGSMWTIALNAGEPLVRQRFSLAHEFKHVLDNKFIGFLYPDLPTITKDKRAEAVCDYFAGCLLVPRPWLLKAWREGLQTSLLLARHFDVSTAAIDVRLSQVGLRQRAHPRDWTTRSRSGRYYRIGAVATACKVAA